MLINTHGFGHQTIQKKAKKRPENVNFKDKY